MDVSALDLGIAGALVVLILDRVISLVKAARVGDTRGALIARMVEAQEHLVEAVTIKNAVNVRIEAQKDALEHSEAEILRLRDGLHQLRAEVHEGWARGLTGRP